MLWRPGRASLSDINGKDVAIFVMSLLLAFSIWFLHGLSITYTELIRLPVIAEADIDGHAARSSAPVTIWARCRTSGFEIIRLKNISEKNPLVVRFSSYDLHSSKEEVFYLAPNDLNKYGQAIFGDKSVPEAFLSDTLFFRFPFENSKKVPLRAVCQMGFKPQYMSVGGLKLRPDSVLIYGEPSRLKEISNVSTEAFSLDNLEVSAHGSVRLEKIKGVRVSAEKAEYSVDVSRFVEIKSSVPINVRNVPKGHSLIVYPSIASVTLRCAFPVSVNPLDKISFYVDYKDFMESLNGVCLIHTDKMPPEVFEYDIKPQTASCVEQVK